MLQLEKPIGIVESRQRAGWLRWLNLKGAQFQF
jgi:hypothetical protein